jgi:hypothetical protein
MTKKSRPAAGTTAERKPSQAKQGRARAPKADQAPDTAEGAPAATAAPRTREGSKQARLIEMLRRPDGTTIEEVVTAFGWQSHTVRGALAGALKKKLGLKIESVKVEGRGRVYRIVD